MDDEQERLHAIISGKVQGVNFRHYAKLTADQHGVTGWVRNLPDGSVEVIAEGTSTQIDPFLHFLNHGPAQARVDSVHTEWLPATGEFESFEISYAGR